ncbi:hypothetical protein LPJ71_001306, partial [Coemansia sp. S17]
TRDGRRRSWLLRLTRRRVLSRTMRAVMLFRFSRFLSRSSVCWASSCRARRILVHRCHLVGEARTRRRAPS